MIGAVLLALAQSAVADRPPQDPCARDRDAMLGLLREWRYRKGDYDPILFRHERRLRAIMGETQAAIALTHRSEASDDFGWNAYVGGTHRLPAPRPDATGRRDRSVGADTRPHRFHRAGRIARHHRLATRYDRLTVSVA